MTQLSLVSFSVVQTAALKEKITIKCLHVITVKVSKFCCPFSFCTLWHSSEELESFWRLATLKYTQMSSCISFCKVILHLVPTRAPQKAEMMLHFPPVRTQEHKWLYKVLRGIHTLRRSSGQMNQSSLTSTWLLMVDLLYLLRMMYRQYSTKFSETWHTELFAELT